MKRFLYILLAALLLATVNTAMAEDNILIAPVDEEAVVLEDVAPSVDVNVEALENVALQADAPVANYVSGNLAHFVQPSDGDILSPGEVEILLTYDDDGVWGSSGHLLTDAEIYNNYMPTYLGITKDGHTEVVEIRNINITFNGTSKCYATVNLTEPGTYRLSIASHLGTSDPEVITVTVDDGSSSEPQPENPGYYLIPEQTEYTINLAYSDTACFNFRLSLYRMETDYNWGFGQSGDDVVELISAKSNSGDIPPLREEDGRYVCDFSLVFQGTGVGTAYLEIGVYVGNAEYDKHTITFHVINDPSVKPAPVNISKCAVTVKDQTYTGKALKPVVTVKYGKTKLVNGTDYTVSYKNNKEAGTATVTLTGKGNFTGTKKLTFAINPKNVSISKLAAGTKQLSVQWTAREDVTGYEIEYGLNSKLKDGTTVKVKKAATAKKVIKGLKSGKKYYVHIRAYRKVGRKTYWSAWSKTKSTKVQ